MFRTTAGLYVYLDLTAALGPCVGKSNSATIVTALNRQQDEMQEKKPPQNTFNTDFAGRVQEFSACEHSQNKMKPVLGWVLSLPKLPVSKDSKDTTLSNYSSISTALSSLLY